VFIASSGAITWSSKKQVTKALSSTEAEYIAMSEAVQEVCWLHSLHSELGILQTDAPMLLHGDNEGSIAMAKNPVFHQRAKHIDIHWHWVRDLVQDVIIEFVSVHNPEQTAAIFTKALPCIKHNKHVIGLGLISV